MNSLRKKILVLALFVLGMVFFQEVMAQCPMCKIAAESNMENGGESGNGLNTGILYMFAAPYLIVGFIAFMWWRNKKNFDNGDYIDLLDE
ncbi:MAG TPA: hypothetical protein ENK85_12670 [Saprospiraceae bacterium]|nr:hypothetical protein [Saprospiraceae bacterium]